MTSSSKISSSDAAIRKQKKKSIACRRCHSHKIKCTGGQPCLKCRQAGCPAECHYVNRDRQVKVHESVRPRKTKYSTSYLEELAAENQRLRSQLSQSPGLLTPTEHRGHDEDLPEPDADTHVRNPMLGERAWFLPYDPSLPPIHVCEAACTAFATRLRKVLTKSEITSHMPRTQYTPETALMKICNPAMKWPSLPRARLLLQIVFSQVTRVYHLVLRKSTIDELEDAYRKDNFDDAVLTCKFFALFALGEVYSARSTPRKRFPESFLQREQKLLISLKEWSCALPPQIRLNRDGPVPMNVISLHLQFNQCIMLASRPILLHALIQATSPESTAEDNAQKNIRQTLKTLCDACIHAARHTHSLIVEEWTNGSVPIFGYFYAHYLFSSALIMVISSLVYPENSNDFALFEAAFEILRAMSSHGNLAATEFYDNLECVKQCLDKIQMSEGSHFQSDLSRVAETSTDSLAVIAPNQLGVFGNAAGSGIPEPTVPANYANDMAFLGESMEEFLAQPDVDFLLDPSLTDTVYSWPNLSLWTA
ncbi:hypothetical protein HAV15_003429 [Penicillium sp. str. |nr:hypothetical protein HAV15_003429 [Penicillium sp. str. \